MHTLDLAYVLVEQNSAIQLLCEIIKFFIFKWKDMDFGNRYDLSRRRQNVWIVEKTMLYLIKNKK